MTAFTAPRTDSSATTRVPSGSRCGPTKPTGAPVAFAGLYVLATAGAAVGDGDAFAAARNCGVSGRQVATLVEAFGPQRLSVIGIPGMPPLARLEDLGVARVSYGPMPQNVALTALQELVEEVHRGGGVPRTMRMLN